MKPIKNKKATATTLLNLISAIPEKEVPAKADGSLDIEAFQKHPTVQAVVTLLKAMNTDIGKFPIARMLIGSMWAKGEVGDCILCDNRYFHFGNNPSPVSEEGRCCDKCNTDKVIPARLAGPDRYNSQADSNK